MHPFAFTQLAQVAAPAADLLSSTWAGDGVPWLSLLIFLPLVGVVALMALPKEQKAVLRHTALSVSLLVFVVSLGVLFGFDATAPVTEGPFTFQLAEGPIPWIESLGVFYYLGVDGLSLWLVVLATFIMPIGILSTYSAVEDHVKEFMICLLLLETGMIGALVSLDMLLFYVFWEVMLIPMYFIIGIWGGEERIAASVKFFIYTMVGSLLMLVGLLYIYYLTGIQGSYSFLLTDMLQVELSHTEQMWLFGAFFLAFAIKVPIFPFHTWLPHAHVQAPTVGSVILAGVLLKMGTYGLLRFAFPFFPDATVYFAPYIAVLCLIGITYGALLAMVQDDVKKVVAYSSVAHLGFCVLGLVSMTPAGIAGGIYVMIAHGISTGALFLAIGVLYERRHTKKIAAFGGVAKAMPIFAVLFMIAMFASVGLPGLNGFVGEFLALLGTSKSNILSFTGPVVFIKDSTDFGAWNMVVDPTNYPVQDTLQAGPEFTAWLFAAIGASGVIFAAAYLLWMWRRVMFGPLDKPENKALKDINVREFLYLSPMIVMAIFMGIFPQFFLGRMEPSIDQYLNYMQTKAADGEKYIVVEQPDPEWVVSGRMLDNTSAEQPVSDTTLGQ